MLDISVFLLKSFDCDQFLWLFWRSCFLIDSFFMNNVPLKVKFSIFPSCCINNSLTPFLLSPQPIQPSFRCLIDEVLSLWKYLVWYCWLGFFCWYCLLVFCGCVEADLVHYNVVMYFQNSGFKWVQSLNGVISCLYMLSLGFQIPIQLWGWM